MKKTLSFLVILLLFFVVSVMNVNAACTQSGISGNFSVDETATATITCTASDKNDDGFYVFFNSTNGNDAMDDTANITFTVPSTSPFIVFATWKVTANQAPQVNLSGVLYIEDVLISDARFNTTTVGGKNVIDIINVEITDEIFEGRTAGITGKVQVQGKNVGYADICLDILDENNEPFQHIGCKKSEVDGEFFFSTRCDETNWCTAGDSFIIDIDASCPQNSTSYISCVDEDGDDVSFATGKRSASFTIVDMGDKMIIPKQYNSSLFGVYMRNQFGAKVQMRKNPAFVAQEDIDWSGFNNTNTTFNVNQTGEAYLTAGELASICMLVNNTLPDEREIELSDVHFDDDTLQQLFHPLDPTTGEVLRNIDFASFGVKSFSDEGILAEKCTDQFLIPDTIRGANDWDVNFHYVVEDFVQLIEAESEEFHIYGQVRGKDFVPIVDIKNVSTSVFNTNVNACTDINVTINYDYFGVTERSFVIIYEFEETTDDVQIGREIKRISPDIGKGNNITDTLTLPFTDYSGEAEVVITIFNKELSLGGKLVGFGDTEPHNTFNITADLSDECRFKENQELELRRTVATENISQSAGTFDFSIDVPNTVGSSVTISGTGKTGQGNVLNRDLNIKCQVDGQPSTATEFKVFSTDTFSFTKTVNVGLSVGTYTMSCTAIDRFFVEDAVQATDNFEITPSSPRETGDGSGGGGGFIAGFPSKVAGVVEELLEIPIDIIKVAGKNIMDLLRPIFRLINQVPLLFLMITIFVVLGGRDIYRCVKLPNGKWLLPR